MKKIAVLIVDDHPLVRRGMIAVLDSKDDIAIVGEAGDGEAAVRLAQQLKPDVIMMDLQMPVLDGVAATRQIKQSCTHCRVLVVSSFFDDELVISALRAGADGYLLKSNVPGAQDELYSAIVKVHNGGAPLDPSITAAVLRSFGDVEEIDPAAHDGLTERELAVLRLVAVGMSDQQIGEELGISKRTASAHVSNILSKLGVDNRTQAALYAIRNNLIDP